MGFICRVVSNQVLTDGGLVVVVAVLFLWLSTWLGTWYSLSKPIVLITVITGFYFA